MVAGFFAFLAIGASVAVYGPLRSAWEAQFGLTPQGSIRAVQVHYIGAILGILAVPHLARRMPSRVLLSASCLLLGFGALGVCLSPSWALTCAAAFVLGLGFGLVDMAENAVFAANFGQKQGRMLVLLNSMFAIGSVLAPAALAALSKGNHIYLAVAGFAFVAAALHWSAGGATIPDAPTSNRPPLGGVLVLCFVTMYIAYIMVEVGIGASFAKQIEANLPDARPDLWTSGFWGALALSRLIFAPFADRLNPSRQLAAIAIGVIGLAVVALQAGWMPAAIVGIGFCMGPFFPVGLYWLEKIMPGDSRALSMVITFGCLGGVAGPYLVSAWSPSQGHSAPAYVALAVMLLAATLATVALVSHAVKVQS